MRKLMLALMATAAISFPAFAQQQGQQPQAPQSQSETQQQQISVSELSPQQIREVQVALNKKGFEVGRVDGIWGPETEEGLRRFQNSMGIQAHGQLDERTISALGLKTSQFVSGQPSKAGTVGAGPSQPGRAQPEKSPGQPGSSGQQAPMKNGAGSPAHETSPPMK